MPLTPPPSLPPLDPQAQLRYEALYAAYWKQAYDLALKLLSDPWAAEDAAQQAFLGVWCHWATVNPLPLRAQVAYVLRATRNATTDTLRHRQSHPGGEPRSLSAPIRGASGGQGEDSDLLFGAIFADQTPDHDPERATLGREELRTLMASAGAGALRRIELLLTAQGYLPREIAQMMRRASAAHPNDPHARQYQQSTTSSIKMRRSRRRRAAREKSQPSAADQLDQLDQPEPPEPPGDTI